MRTVLAFALATSLVVALPGSKARGLQANQADTTKKATKELPLKPTRHARFTTSKATWTSLDVSPDGRTIVFDLLGDLYTLPIEGGRATPLLTGMAYDAQPRFSPDGKRVVFVSDRSGGENVWTLSLDRRDTVQVTKGNENIYASPEWTPDGQYVLASKAKPPFGDAGKLWIYHVRGGTGTQLVAKSGPTVKQIGAAFGSDGRRVWFAQRTGDWDYNAKGNQYSLAYYDRETGLSGTTVSRWGSAFRPALSPDGRWIVYGARFEEKTGLRIRDVQNTDDRWLAFPVQHDEIEGRATSDALPGYSFTPDSKAVVTSYGGEIWRVSIETGEATKIPFAADVDLELGPLNRYDYPIPDSATFVARQIRDPVPSPDGRRVAFTVMDRVYVMDLPSGTPRRLTDSGAGEVAPTWSPDGRWIAFTTWTNEHGGQIHRVAAAGGRPEQLTRATAFYRNVVWSPDGNRIIAIRSSARDRRDGRGGGSELVWIPVAGGDITVIGPVDYSTPHFTSDPNRIYATSGSEGLISFRWDGTDRKSHVKITGSSPGGSGSRSASPILMGPLGDQALAVFDENFYLVTVPQVGSDPATVALSGGAFPVRRITDIGGEFPTWSADAKKVFWGAGNALIMYDLDRAQAFEDSVTAAKRARGSDTTRRADTATAKFRPDERRVTIDVTRDIPQSVVALRGARLLTMKGKEIIENGDIVVTNNRITAVGRRGSVTIPPGAHVIDLAGKTIVPGFVDPHYHGGGPSGTHPEVVANYAAALAYGVTTIRDPSSGTTDFITYADRINAGEMIGPRVYTTGPAFLGAAEMKNLDEARNVMKRYAQYYDTKTFKMYMTGNRQVRQWMAIAAKEMNISPTTEGGIDWRLNMTHAIDGYAGIEHSLPIYPIYNDVIQLFVQSETTNTPTLIVSYGGPWGENYFYETEEVHNDDKLRRFNSHESIDGKTRRIAQWFRTEEYGFTRHGEFLKDLVAAGGRIGVGAHGQLAGLGYHWELQLIQSGGMPQYDALRAATILGADYIGLGKDIGSIEPGKLADLVVLERNPLADIRNSRSIQYVMKNGRLHDGNTLAEVWPRKKEWWKPMDADAPVVKAGIPR